MSKKNKKAKQNKQNESYQNKNEQKEIRGENEFENKQTDRQNVR